MQVRDLVEECQCASQFSMIRVSEGKYRIGDTKILIFVRVGIPAMESHDIFLKNLFHQILRSHVMVRVGGGWDTLQNYLDKHDPCRCRRGDFLTILKKTILGARDNWAQPPKGPTARGQFT